MVPTAPAPTRGAGPPKPHGTACPVRSLRGAQPRRPARYLKGEDAAAGWVRRYGGTVHDEPIDPFAGDPADPSNELADLDEVETEAGGSDPLTPAEREDVLEDLADL